MPKLFKYHLTCFSYTVKFLLYLSHKKILFLYSQYFLNYSQAIIFRCQCIREILLPLVLDTQEHRITVKLK